MLSCYRGTIITAMHHTCFRGTWPWVTWAIKSKSVIKIYTHSGTFILTNTLLTSWGCEVVKSLIVWSNVGWWSAHLLVQLAAGLVHSPLVSLDQGCGFISHICCPSLLSINNVTIHSGAWVR